MSVGFKPKGTAFVVFTKGDAVLSEMLKSIGNFPTYYQQHCTAFSGHLQATGAPSRGDTRPYLSKCSVCES